MQLKKLGYSELVGTPQEWTLEGLQLSQKTLLVGRNASGKSRTLSVIANLARGLAGLQKAAVHGSYDCTFEDAGRIYHYSISTLNSLVVSEKLIVDDVVKLERNQGGAGFIFAEKVANGSTIEFQTPDTDIAAVSRRDAIQHSFLEPLYRWASTVRYYQFGTSLGKDAMAIFTSTGMNVDERDPNAVVGIFRDAEKKFGEEFKNAIKSDMNRIGYNIEDVGIAMPISINLEGLPGVPMALFVKENDLPGITDQIGMSQGMFRVLSLLIHVNYIQMRNSTTCVLIDDIGEGLDFSRSCRLINLLREKSDNSDIQIILSTNDKFVMNEVPLPEWSVLQRVGNHVKVRNYENSKKIFDEFKFTGLSNFSFLELDIINEEAEGPTCAD
jgi:energy-coupling factor transporter ATP-binding protein EcfA2